MKVRDKMTEVLWTGVSLGDLALCGEVERSRSGVSKKIRPPYK